MSMNSIFSLILRQFIILNLITLTQPSGWQLQSPLRKPLFQRKRKMRGFLLSKSPSCSQRMKAVFLTRWSILMYEYVWQQHACVSRGRSLTHIYMLAINVVTVVEFLSESCRIQCQVFSKNSCGGVELGRVERFLFFQTSNLDGW